MDRCIKRPKFKSTIELFYYDESVPLHKEPYLWTTICYLNEGKSESNGCERKEKTGESECYNANQAAYVALLMEHETALKEFDNEDLDERSAFHEDFWDEVLDNLSTSWSTELRPIQEFHQFHKGSSTTQLLRNHKPDEDEALHPGVLEWIPHQRPAISAVDIAEVIWDHLQKEEGDLRPLLALQGLGQMDYITVETYGYFDYGDRGRKTVQVPLGSMEHWRRILRDAWSEYGAENAMILWIDPQPDEGHILHVLLHKEEDENQPIILLEAKAENQVKEQRLLRVQQPMTKASLCVQCGWHLDDTLDAAILKHKGRIWTPVQQTNPVDGQLWELLYDNPHDFQLLQYQAEVHQNFPNVLRFASSSGDNNVEMRSTSEDSNEVEGTSEGDCQNDDEGENGESESTDPGNYDWEAELPPSLQRIATFRLGAEVPLMSITSMNSQETFYGHLAALWHLRTRQIEDVIIVHPVPDFAAQQGCWPYIVEADFDRVDKVNQILAVVQIDFYQATSTGYADNKEWQVLVLPPQATRSNVLDEAELENYCEMIVEGRRCIVWHNEELWAEQGGPRRIQDGDFLRIAVPPRSDSTTNSTPLEVLNAYEAGRTIGPPRSMDDTDTHTDITGDLPDPEDVVSTPDSVASHTAMLSKAIANDVQPDDLYIINEEDKGITNLFPEEVWVGVLQDDASATEPHPVVLYGLLGEHVGTRRGKVPRLDKASLDNLVNRFWPGHAHHRKNLIMVTPQPRDVDPKALHILVEYIDANDLPHPGLSPVLEDVHLWNEQGILEDIRQPVYHHSQININQLLHGFGNWCDEGRRYYCDAWIRERPLRHGELYPLLPGDLVALRLTPKRPEEMAWVTEDFPNAPNFYQSTISRSAKENTKDVQWQLHAVDERGTATMSTYNPPWYGQHSPRAVVEAYRESMGINAQLEVYFVNYQYQETGELHFVAQVQEDPGEVCLLTFVVQTQEGVEEEGTRGAVLSPTSTIDELMEVAGFPRWSSSSSCPVTVQINGRTQEQEMISISSVIVRSGDHIQMTISIRSWARLAADLTPRDAEATSLLQVKAVRKKRFKIQLAQHLASEEGASSEVHLPITLLQVSEFLGAWYNHPLQEVQGIVDKVEVPETTAKAMSQQKVGDQAQTLHLFTDGSYRSGDESMAWSFVAIRTDKDDYLKATELQCIGYACGRVTTDPACEHWKGANKSNAYVAEMEALLQAQWWAIGHDEGGKVHIHYDALSAGNAAKGAWGYETAHKLCVLTRVLAQSLELCSPKKVEYHHVAAHTGDPWNELADTLANACRQGSIPPSAIPSFSWRPWLYGNYVIGAEHLPLALQLLQGQKVLPSGNGEKFSIKQDSAPATEIALWPLDLQSDAGVQERPQVETVHLKCCSYNVRTLQDPKNKTSDGIAEYLRAQLSQAEYHLCALQETRARTTCTIESTDFIRLVVAGENGQGGCELWVGKTNRIGGQTAFTLQHLTVIHQETSILAVRIRIGREFLVAITAHAPHSGRPEEERLKWWEQLSKVVKQGRMRGRLILMGDFNAQFGAEVEQTIGEVLNEKGTHNGTQLGRLLQEASMWVPSTYSHCHKGEIGTWVHPKTKQAIRLDYIALDHRLAAFDVRSEIDEEIDHPGAGEDHRVVSLDFSFALAKTKSHQIRTPIDEVAVSDPANYEKIEEIIKTAPEITWETNIHDHYAEIAKNLYQNLSTQFPQTRKQPRRHYISSTTWLCRASKITMRKALIRARKSQDEETAQVIEAQLKEISGQLRHLLQDDRKRHIDEMLLQVDNAPPNQVYAKLRRLGIGAQSRKYTKKALPMMKCDDGSYASTYEESQKAWRKHAATLEGGREVEEEHLLRECDERQRLHGCQELPKGANVPTRTQVERACRRLQPYKARGPDGLPAALYHQFPASMAALLHPMMVKMVCQLAEPLGFKGGKLIHLYKGKGPADEPANRRGILISNHASKVAHGALRGQFTPFLERGMLPMQIGGRAHKSVQQSAHMLRLFMDLCRNQNLSCGVVFLDIRTAYYKVLRELVTKKQSAPNKLQDILDGFNLPPHALQALEQRLQEDDSIARRMGVGSYLEALLGELHTDTWFTTPGLTGVTATTIGTRPGSCFADVFFNFLFAEVLKEVKDELAEYGVLTELQWNGTRSLYVEETQECQTEVVAETGWADDLALFFQSSDPNQLVHNLRAGTTVLLNACWRFGLEPNFTRGKTEAIVALRGKGSVGARRKWFTHEGGRLPLPECHAPDSQIRMVARYKHLGGQVDAKAKSKAEIHARVGQMRQAFKSYKKSLFTVQSINPVKRAQLLRPLVLSIMEYNIGTLTSLTEADQQYMTTALLGIYKTIWRKPGEQTEEDHRIGWARLCYALQLPTPRAILQMARVRYFSQIYRHGSGALWALICTQRGWLEECSVAFDWVYEQISGSTALPDPRVDWTPWNNLIQESPKRFAALLQRAWKHEVLQNYNEQVVNEGYNMFKEAMEMAQYTFAEEAKSGRGCQDQHICLACERSFKSRTGWASHAFKCHQRVNEARKFAGGTFCPACRKEYWEFKRLLLHLRYSGDCRRQLAMAGMEVEKQPGIGSREQKRQREELLQPWIEVPGASIPIRDYWAGIGTTWDDELLSELFHNIPLSDEQVPSDVDVLLEELRVLLKGTTVEYGIVKDTLECWKESMLDVAQRASQPRAALIRAFFVTFGQIELTTWLVPRACQTQMRSAKKWKHVLDEGQVQYDAERTARPQGQWYRTMFVVHFFSGRRREKDLQSYLESISYPDQVRVEVLSADIIFGEGGDFSQRHVQQKWINWMASGYVLAFYAGPPCETYSVARGHELTGVKVRPIRTRLCPWGFGSLTLREARQILIGNLLILFVLRAAMVQAAVGHFACIEHPAEPEGEKHINAVSIWRLQLMSYLYKLKCVTKCTIRQGQYGAPSPKPTTLLFVGPKNPAKSLKHFEAEECSKGVSIGLESGGRVFQTAKLKEYPGPLCAALARALQDWIAEHDPSTVTDLENPVTEALDHLEVFKQKLDVQTELMGPDYNPAAKAL